MRPALRRHWAALSVLAALTAYRASLLGAGAFAWPDESYYANALRAAAAAGRLDLRGFTAALLPYARPLAVIGWLLPAAIQTRLGAATGLGPTHPASALVPTALNLAVLLALGGVYYGLALRLLERSRPAATAALAVYGTMAGSNLYVRHVLPYDAGLLLLLAAWLVGLAAPGNTRAALGSGALAAGALSTYPALQPGLAALALFIVLAPRAPEGTAVSRYGRLGAFAAPVAAALLLWTVAGRWAGVSYLGQLRALASLHSRLDQGRFDEGFAFVPRYLVQVEGALGVALLALFAGYTGWAAVQAGRRRAWRALDAVLACVLAAWLVHGFAAVVLRRVFFTSRYAHAYMPFLVLGAVAAPWSLRAPRLSRAGLVALAAVAAGSLAAFDRAYRPLAYPVNVMARAGLGYADFAAARREARVTLAERFTAETIAALDFVPRGRAPFRELEDAGGGRYLLLNVGFVPQGFEVRPPPPVPPLAEELAGGPHFLSFPGCQFEHLPPEQRALLRGLDLRMAVYRLGGRR